MGKLNFTTERIGELLAKAQGMPEAGDVETRAHAASAFQPKGDYVLASALSAYATLAALNSALADITALQTGLAALKGRFETLLGDGDVTAVIDSFNEMEAFLAGVTNRQTLTGLLAEQRAEVVGLIPTGTAKQTDLTALAARVAQLEAASATHATDISGLQTEMAKRPALPADATQGVYAVENGAYAKIFNGDETILIL